MGAISSGVLGPEIWGVITTLSNSQSGCRAGSGSSVKTSRMAPPRRLARSLLERSRPIDPLRLGDHLSAPAHADHVHAESASGPRYGAPDVAESDHAERGAVEAQWIGLPPAPLALLATEDLSPLGEPEAPAEHVFRHPRSEDARDAGERHGPGQLGDEKALDAGAHVLHPAEGCRARQELERKVPGVENLGVRDVESGRRRRPAGVNLEEGMGLLDEPGIGQGQAGIGVVHEDGARGHAPILERRPSSNEKSTSRLQSPSR